MYQTEYAILKKWTEDAATVRCWIDEAERRRKHYDSIPSIGAMLQLRSFAWAEEADSRTPDSTPQ